MEGKGRGKTNFSKDSKGRYGFGETKKRAKRPG